MTARLNHMRDYGAFSDSSSNLVSDRPRINFNTARTEEDPFPDPSLLDPADTDQHGEIHTEVETMKNTASNNGLPPRHNKMLGELEGINIDVFRISFSPEIPARIKPLRIELTSDVRSVKTRLRNYSQEQRALLKDSVPKLSETVLRTQIQPHRGRVYLFWFTSHVLPVFGLQLPPTGE